MKRKILTMLLSLTLVVGSVPSETFSLELSDESLSNIDYDNLSREEELSEDGMNPQFLAELKSSNSITVTTHSQLFAAVQQGIQNIKVKGILTLSDKNGADPDGRIRPIMIKDGTTIEGIGSDPNIFLRGPLQLEGDVTIKNIGLKFNSSDSLGSEPHREIFLAGHKLTLDNVSTYLKGDNGSLGGFGSSEDELLPTVYAGAYRGINSNMGNSASLIVQNSIQNTMFKDIYMSHDAGQYEMVGYNGDATLELDAKALVRGGIYTDKNNTAKITLNSTSGGESSRIKKLIGNDKTTLTLNNIFFDGANVENVGDIILIGQSAKFKPLSGTFKKISVPANTVVDFSNIGNVQIQDFIGGGKVVLDPNGSVEIEKISSQNPTTIVAGDVLSPKDFISGHCYISFQGVPTDEKYFILDSHYDTKFALNFVKGKGWVASQTLAPDAPTPTISKVEIRNAPTAIDISNLTKMPDDSSQYPIEIIWYDDKNSVISPEIVYNEGFEYGYTMIIKSEYWGNNTANDNATDWGNAVNIQKKTNDDGDPILDNLYYVCGDPNGQDASAVKEGNYTLLFFDEEIDLQNAITVREVKEALKNNKVLAQVEFSIYNSSSSGGGHQENLSSATIAPIADQPYTGSMITPNITVTYNGQTLTLGKDYVVNYANNINTGNATVTVTGIGNYTGTKQINFQIVKADSEVTLTADKTDFTYGEQIRFVFKANAKKKTRSARVQENMVEFFCGNEILGMARVDANGQAVLVYNTTDRKIPTGTSQIGVRFGGNTGLKPIELDNKLSITLNKKSVSSTDIASITLEGFVYDGQNKKADIQYITLTDGSTISAIGYALLPKLDAGSYAKAQSPVWELAGEDANWYKNSTSSTSGEITVSPPVQIKKAVSPIVPNQYLTVKQGGNVGVSLSGFIDSTKGWAANITPNSGSNGQASFDNKTMTFSYKANNASGEDTFTVNLTSTNYEDINFNVNVKVVGSNTVIVNPDITTTSKTYDGRSYNGVTGNDISNVNLTYYDLKENKDLGNTAPVAAGSYSVTANWKDNSKVGTTVKTFEINPIDVTIKANNRTILLGETAPDLSNPKEGIDYILSLPLIQGDSILVQMGYGNDLNTNVEGTYDILINVPVSDDNYNVTLQNSKLTVKGGNPSPGEKYQVTVIDGSGSGQHKKGDIVTIKANDKPGYTFIGWSSADGVNFADIKAKTTTFEMPAKPVTVIANFKKDGDNTLGYMVTVNGGSGSGEYSEGDIVTIIADKKPGYTFTGWSSVDDITFQDSKAETTAFKMPAKAVTVTANFQKDSDVKYKVTIIDGSGDGNYSEGDTVTIIANKKSGYTFTGWSSVDGVTFEDSKAETTTFKMPAKAVTVMANFSTNNTGGIISGGGSFIGTTDSTADIKDESEPVEEIENTQNIESVGNTVSVNDFKDINESDYFYDAVKWGMDSGIISGIEEDTFAPNESCTRAQMMTFLWRVAGSPIVESAESQFEDVSSDSYYYNAVQWAASKGITSGTTDTTFSPDDEVTRGQTIAFLYRANGMPDISGDNNFKDVSDNMYYADAVQWAVSQGITSGTSGNTFSPTADCTRAQTVTLLYRCFK
ncbi:MAG: S-layer homology domain-containing protein [Clostridiales bacterium]|nr:S-layer homology domain-containing protein [Clostridiales bacterium]